MQLPTGKRWCLAFFRWTPSRHWRRLPGRLPAVALSMRQLLVLFFCAMFSTNHFPAGCKLRYTNFVECDLDAFACICWMLGDLVLEHLLNCGEDAKLSESSQQRETKDAWLCNSRVMCVFSSLLFPKLYKMFIIVYVVGPYVSLWLATVSS